MEFEITHVTHYKYGHPAAEAYGEARLTPPNLPGQTVLSHRLVIDPEVKTSGYVDHFGNQVDFFSLPFRHKQLFVSNQAKVGGGLLFRRRPGPRQRDHLASSFLRAHRCPRQSSCCGRTGALANAQANGLQIERTT
jgi:hypothetical protein